MTRHRQHLPERPICVIMENLQFWGVLKTNFLRHVQSIKSERSIDDSQSPHKRGDDRPGDRLLWPWQCPKTRAGRMAQHQEARATLNYPLQSVQGRTRRRQLTPKTSLSTSALRWKRTSHRRICRHVWNSPPRRRQPRGPSLGGRSATARSLSTKEAGGCSRHSAPKAVRKHAANMMHTTRAHAHGPHAGFDVEKKSKFVSPDGEICDGTFRQFFRWLADDHNATKSPFNTALCWAQRELKEQVCEPAPIHTY